MLSYTAKGLVYGMPFSSISRPVAKMNHTSLSVKPPEFQAM